MIPLTLLETRCALTIVRTARDELHDKLMLMQPPLVLTQDALTHAAALEIENRIYVLQGICQKLWIALKRLEEDTGSRPSIRLGPEDKPD